MNTEAPRGPRGQRSGAIDASIGLFRAAGPEGALYLMFRTTSVWASLSRPGGRWAVAFTSIGTDPKGALAPVAPKGRH